MKTEDPRQTKDKSKKNADYTLLLTLMDLTGITKNTKYTEFRLVDAKCRIEKHFSGKTRGLNQRNGRQNADSQSSDSENPGTQISMIPTQRKRIRLREKPFKHY